MHVPVDVDLLQHPKLKKLARLLDRDTYHAFGHLVGLWCWAMRYAEDGDLSDYSHDEIADGAGWNPAEGNTFVSALESSGWVNDGSLHAWERWGGKVLKSNEKAKRRMAQGREKKREHSSLLRERSANVTRTFPPDKDKEKEKEKEEDTGEVQAPSPAPAVLTIPLLGQNKEHPIIQADIDQWQELFPGIDVAQKLREIKAWNLANPNNRKTKSGIKKHIVSWLTKEQNKARREDPRSTESQKTVTIPSEEFLKRERECLGISKPSKSSSEF